MYSIKHKICHLNNIYFVVCKCFQFGLFQILVIWYRVNFSSNDKIVLRVNPFPNNKILALTKLKGFADKTFNDAEMMISVLDRQENIVGIGENAGYQHFLLFPQCFQKASSVGP